MSWLATYMYFPLWQLHNIMCIMSDLLWYMYIYTCTCIYSTRQKNVSKNVRFHFVKPYRLLLFLTVVLFDFEPVVFRFVAFRPYCFMPFPSMPCLDKATAGRSKIASLRDGFRRASMREKSGQGWQAVGGMRHP